LGGVTRLVARRSSSSPSVSAPSPNSQNSASPTIAEATSYIAAATNEGTSAGAAWQNYTHIQNFNVNISMGDYYPGSGLSVTPEPQEVPMMYQMSGHVHQQQQQQQQQQLAQQYHVGMPMDMGSQVYYGAHTGYSTGYGNGNGNGYSMVQASPELMTPSHDPQDSWQNFMAQYKQ
jgi:hypothetical protein